jgi:hypothetical protein
MEKSRAWKDGLYLLLLGNVAFVLISLLLVSRPDSAAAMDFRTAYYSGQCLLHSPCDPYSEHDIDALYRRHVERVPVSARNRLVVTNNVYLPTSFPFTLLFGMLPFDWAIVLWCLLINCSLMVAVGLIWCIAAPRAPLLVGTLLGFCIATSGSLAFLGNPGGFIVPFCVVSACCFIYGRYVPLGIACLAVSLAFKPHDAWLIWLCFFLAGRPYRVYALKALAVFAALSLPAIAWVFWISPHWITEFGANLHFWSQKGGMNDPSGGHGACLLTNLQTVTSFFWADPHTYDLASYLICAPLIVIWVFLTLRARTSTSSLWMALASASALTLLPVYHRQYDTKLIILAVPACVALWMTKGALGRFAVAFTAVAFFVSGDLPWVAFLGYFNHQHWSATGRYGRLLLAVWDFPTPLGLLAMGIFYLWIYARLVRSPQAEETTAQAETGPSTLPHPA